MLAVPELAGVKLELQLAAVLFFCDRLQLVGLRLPDTPLEDRLTVPVGTAAPWGDVSATVTVQFAAWFTTTGVEHETDVTVE